MLNLVRQRVVRTEQGNVNAAVAPALDCVSHAPMLPPGHPLEPAQVRAALASGWPTLECWTDEPERLPDIAAGIAQVVGAVPQAEIIEPWEAGEAHGLRCDLPGLDPARWTELAGVLGELPVRFTLVPGHLPGAREARDSEVVLADVIAGGGLEARCWADVDEGLVDPDLAEEEAAPDAAPLASELVAALREVSPELVRHPTEVVSFVRHRSTGRRGIWLTVPSALVEALDGDALAALRRDVVAAVAGVVARRMDSDVALAPDLLWDPRLGLSVLVWHTGARGRALPGDSVVEAGLSPSVGALVEAADALGGRVYSLEVQVVAKEMGDALDLAARLLPAAETTPLEGSAPRWVALRTEASVEPTFAATWRFAPEDVHAVLPWLEAVLDDPGTAAVRVVPVDPVGLEHGAPFLDPAWRWVGRRWIVRWRDGATDGDRVPATITRDATPDDEPVVNALVQALAAVPGALPRVPREPFIRPVVDLTGRDGFRLRWPAAVADQAWLLGWALGALGAVQLAGCASVIDLALPGDGVVAYVWRTDVEDEAPAWVSLR